MSVLILCGVIFILSYLYLSRTYNYWKDKNVPYKKGIFLLGSMKDTVLQTVPFWKFVQNMYCEFPRSRYFGMYQFFTPTIVLRDPELIKLVGVKDFDHFPEHREIVDGKVDPYWGKNLISSRAKEWRHMRPTLSPAFTSSKMKFMYSLMIEVAEEFSSYFLSMKEETIDLDMKDTFRRFTNDVIASSAFGMKCNSFKQKENDFFLAGKRLVDFEGLKILRFFMYTLSPRLMRFLKLKITDKKDSDYFGAIINHAIKTRNESGVPRNDMLHLLMEARKNKLKLEEDSKTADTGYAATEESSYGKAKLGIQITDEDVVSQALIFFIAGFDSTSTLMVSMAHELSQNSDVQEVLRREILETFELCEGKLSYEALMKMKYMDMVVSESLRKWPPGHFTDRKCVKPYVLPPVKRGDKPVKIDEGTLIWIPIFSIHRDPEYYPQPDKFDPERFSPERVKDIKPFTYMPFGVGPRNCIGSRFALMEVKILFFYLLKDFEIIPSKNTPEKIAWDPKQFNYMPLGGWKMTLKKISSK